MVRTVILVKLELVKLKSCTNNLHTGLSKVRSLNISNKDVNLHPKDKKFNYQSYLTKKCIIKAINAMSSSTHNEPKNLNECLVSRVSTNCIKFKKFGDSGKEVLSPLININTELEENL